MKIAITGGTGFIGSQLAQRLATQDHELVFLTRNPENLKRRFKDQNFKKPFQVIQWDGEKEPVPMDVLSDVEGIIHLAGAGIADKRWNQNYKKKLRESRILSTAYLLKNTPSHLKFFIGASAIGYYPSGESPMFEDCQNADNFFGHLCKGWEETAYEFLNSQVTRICHIRTGIVLAPKGGALAQMLPILKTGLGGPLADGHQLMSWIDIEDILGIYTYALENEKVFGPINGVAPHPVTNKELTRMIGKKIFRPTFIPVPKILLRIVLGEVANYLVMSQNISSKKIETLGYQFKYPTLESSLEKNLHLS